MRHAAVIALALISLAAPSEARGAAGHVVLMRHLKNPQAYAAGGHLYVTQQVSRLGAAPVRDELLRIDPDTGRREATLRLGAAFDQALLAGGSLWVTATSVTARSAEETWLLQLDPDSLATRARTLLPGSGPLYGGIGAMAVAGGALWVGSAARLDRISLTDSAVIATVPVRGAGGIDVASDAGGSVLIDSAGGQRSRVQARDPVSGALIRQSPVYEGVSRPYLGGIAGGGLWIGASGGMMGYVERLSLRTLRPVAFAGAQPHPGISAPPAIFGTNGVRAQLMAGILWVSQINAGPTRNYCGSPVSGRSLAPLRLGNWALPLAAGADSLYYVPNVSSPRSQELVRAPIDSRCRQRR